MVSFLKTTHSLVSGELPWLEAVGSVHSAALPQPTRALRTIVWSLVPFSVPATGHGRPLFAPEKSPT